MRFKGRIEEEQLRDIKGSQKAARTKRLKGAAPGQGGV